jgi:hypothetical protein
MHRAPLLLVGLLVVLVGCRSDAGALASPTTNATPTAMPSWTAPPSPSPIPSPSPTAAAVSIPTEPTGPELSGDPVGVEDTDGEFTLTLTVGQDRYRAGQLIQAEAILAYDGSQAEAVMRGSSHDLVGFGLRSDAPPVMIGPAFTSDCGAHPITPGAPLVFSFAKSGGFTPGDPANAFAEAYLAHPELRLPAGTWTIGAGTSFYTGADCGDELHSLSTEVTITVEP